MTITLTDVPDDFTGTPGDDNVYGRGGDDVLRGGEGNDSLRGEDGNDRLEGGDGNDFLDGGDGDDVMIGGEGNDTYVVESASDVVYEKDGEGIDTVKSYIDYTLRPFVENLILVGDTGFEDLNGSGNSLNNNITGNKGDNSLAGWDGNDGLNGGLGDDVLMGGTGNDYLNGGDGSDIATYKDATLGVIVNLGLTNGQNTNWGNDRLLNIENLEGSFYADTLTGNAGGNEIVGLGGGDAFRGGAGDDDLTGGAGVDTFRFESTVTNGLDRIRAFTSGEDLLVFKVADGYSAAAGFEANTTGVATLSGPTFVFQTNGSHGLYYDADGVGGIAAVHLADFVPTVLVATDIIVS